MKHYFFYLKTVLLFAAIAVGSKNVNGQNITCFESIWSNEITGSATTGSPFTTGDIYNPHITVGGIKRGNGLTPVTGIDRYNSSNWGANNIVMDLSDYYEFTITPNQGYEINFTSLIYTGQKDINGPKSFALRSSFDNFQSNIGNLYNFATSALITIDLSSYQNITSAITFRLYGWNSTQPSGTFSVNDFVFNGIVYSAVESYNITLDAGTGQIVDGETSYTNVPFVCLPVAESSCPDWVFAGWVTSAVADGEKPDFVSTPYVPETGSGSNITLYAAYKKERTKSLTNADILGMGAINTSFDYKTISSESGVWTGWFATNNVSLIRHIHLRTDTDGSHLASPTFEDFVYQIKIQTCSFINAGSTTQTSNLRTFYIMDSNNTTVQPTSGDYGSGRPTVNNGLVTINVADFPNSFKIYTDGGAGISNIDVMLVSYNTNPTCCTTIPVLDEISYGNITPASVSVSSAVTNIINSDMDCAITEFGFVYSATNTAPEIGKADVTKVAITGNYETDFNKIIDGLKCGTKYYIRPYAINYFGINIPKTGYGDTETFTTETYNVTFNNEGAVYSTVSESCEVTHPVAPSHLCEEWQFAGWSTVEVTEGVTPNFVAAPYIPTGATQNITLYAVYKKDETKSLSNINIINMGPINTSQNSKVIQSASGTWTGTFATNVISSKRHIVMSSSAFVTSPIFKNFVSQVKIQTCSTGSSTTTPITRTFNIVSSDTDQSYGNGNPPVANGLVTINIAGYPNSFKINANGTAGISDIDVVLTVYRSNPEFYTVKLNNEGVVNTELMCCKTTLPAPVPACDNWEFAGWKSTTVSNEGPVSLVINEFTPTSDTMLYAVYRKMEGSDSYHITRNSSNTDSKGDWKYVSQSLSPQNGYYTIYLYDQGGSTINGNYMLSPEIEYSSITSININMAKSVAAFNADAHTLIISYDDGTVLKMQPITSSAANSYALYEITPNNLLTGVGRLKFWTKGINGTSQGTLLLKSVTVKFNIYSSYDSSPNPLVTPIASAATVIESGFTANWGAVVGATGYELYVYTKDAENPEVINSVAGYNPFEVSGGASTSAKVEGLESGIYYYAVKAIDDHCTSEESEEVMVKVKSGGGVNTDAPHQVSRMVYTVGNTIFVDAQSGETIEVYNVLGQRLVCVAARNGENRITMPTGVLLVRIAGEVVKVIVR